MKYILSQDDVNELIEHLVELGACSSNNCNPFTGISNESCRECWINWFEGRKL